MYAIRSYYDFFSDCGLQTWTYKKMKTKITTILSLVLVLLANNALSAQTTLTLEQCRNQAIEYNKQLKQAALKKEETNAYKKAARTAYLPSLEASATAIYSPREIDLSVPGGFLPTAGSLEAAEAGQFNGISNVVITSYSIHYTKLYESISRGL